MSKTANWNSEDPTGRDKRSEFGVMDRWLTFEAFIVRMVLPSMALPAPIPKPASRPVICECVGCKMVHFVELKCSM